MADTADEQSWASEIGRANARVLVGPGAYADLSATCRLRARSSLSRAAFKALRQELLGDLTTYAVAVARALADAGTPPDAVEVHGRGIGESEPGMRMAELGLEVRGHVRGSDEATFASVAGQRSHLEAAFHNLVPAESISVDAHLIRRPTPAPRRDSDSESGARTISSAPAPRGGPSVTLRVGALLGVLLLVGLGVWRVTATGVAGIAVTPAAAPSATTAPSPASAVGLVETFASNDRRWPDDPASSLWFADGGYRMQPREPGRFVAVQAPAGSYTNLRLTGTFRKLGGPSGGGYGLILRDESEALLDGRSQVGRFYVAELNDMGEVGIWRRDAERWVELLPWTPTEAAHPGEGANVLVVEAIGPRLTFAVNGQTVADLEDASLMQGGVGLFVGGDGNDVLVEQLEVAAR